MPVEITAPAPVESCSPDGRAEHIFRRPRKNELAQARFRSPELHWQRRRETAVQCVPLKWPRNSPQRRAMQVREATGARRHPPALQETETVRGGAFPLGDGLWISPRMAARRQ